ncbi:hypothetical protein ACFV4K_27940 [Nocardia sp. NPDC059764]|uniref:hypothetical protein n=1 Tax=Nocardia sp. NPDC059764 TaxID=3346939 RepID=UPI00364710AA
MSEFSTYFEYYNRTGWLEQDPDNGSIFGYILNLDTGEFERASGDIVIAAHLGGSSVITEVSRLRYEYFVIETERSRSDGRVRVEGPIGVLYDELNMLLSIPVQY